MAKRVRSVFSAPLSLCVSAVEGSLSARRRRRARRFVEGLDSRRRSGGAAEEQHFKLVFSASRRLCGEKIFESAKTGVRRFFVRARPNGRTESLPRLRLAGGGCSKCGGGRRRRRRRGTASRLGWTRAPVRR